MDCGMTCMAPFPLLLIAIVVFILVMHSVRKNRGYRRFRDQHQCARCGAIQPRYARFCSRCGQQLDEL